MFFFCTVYGDNNLEVRVRVIGKDPIFRYCKYLRDNLFKSVYVLKKNEDPNLDMAFYSSQKEHSIFTHLRTVNINPHYPLKNDRSESNNMRLINLT